MLDLTGQRFGRLVVLREADKRGAHRAWQCACDCGFELPVRQLSLRAGVTVSCGCRRQEGSKPRHGHSRIGKPEYVAWRNMLNRCENPNWPRYADYGGRGIGVCDRWHRYENFLEDMGERPSSKHSLERLKNDEGYRPGNCVWATKRSQANNNRRSVRINFRGRTQSLMEWAEELDINYQMTAYRIRNGMPGSDAISMALERGPAGRRARRLKPVAGVLESDVVIQFASSIGSHLSGAEVLRELKIQNKTRRRPDLLLRRNGQVVPVEAKVKAKPGAVRQLLRYMELEGAEQGVLVATKFTKGVAAAAARHGGITIIRVEPQSNPRIGVR